MALIEWRKEFETGVADVDHEHRELVDLINALHGEIGKGAAKERIREFLGEVFARIAAHHEIGAAADNQEGAEAKGNKTKAPRPRLVVILELRHGGRCRHVLLVELRQTHLIAKARLDIAEIDPVAHLWSPNSRSSLPGLC